jgi:3-hydroxyisobutyrate dehydrogenase
MFRLQRRLLSNSAAPTNYGFIGLGQMGRHMAMNLASKTKAPVFIYDVQENAMDDFVARAPTESPITPCESPMSVAMQSNVIITMLPSSPHVKSVYLDPSTGLINGLRKNAVVIDSSTIDPATSQDVQEKLLTSAESLKAVVDAPVSGGTC